MTYLFLTILLFGLNFTLWFFIGWARIFDDIFLRRRREEEFERLHGAHSGFDPVSINHIIIPKEVAIIVPAYNEEMVVADTITSLLPLVPRENIFINSYGSKDRTAEIAREYGVTVLNDEWAGKAKADKLQNTITMLQKNPLYKAALFVDADTRIDSHFLERALPLLSSKGTVAVAGYATTLWDRENTPFWNMFYVAYRERMYFYTQMIVKYAQTWRKTNVSPIIPGFASLYRMDVLPKIDINPKGLVIEDFNMTFEVHHKKLGKIAHRRDIFATTQDPDNFKDYVKQVNRWDLGFWQTVRRHGFWPSFFSVSLSLYVFDVLLGSVIILMLPLAMIVLVAPFILGDTVFSVVGFSTVYFQLRSITNFQSLFFGMFIVDYGMTVVAAISQKRPQYLLFGLGFLFLRIVDSFIYVATLPKAFLVDSNGVWKSPTRR